MPAGILRPCLAGARVCAACLLTLLLWTLWLVLAIALIFQAYIASVNEMPVPRFLLNGIEEHLAASGVSVRFGRAIFDPTGRVLLEKTQFTLGSFAEPVVTADAIYLKLDPWALLARRFEAREIRATGANLFVPAMLSASGRPEKIVQDLDAGFSIASRGDEFTVDYLNCRLGEICVSAHGQVNAGPVARSGIQATELPLTEFLSGNYVALSRELLRAEEQLSGFDQAVVTAVLTPSDTRGAIVNAEMFAAGVKMTSPVAVEATRIRAASRFPLLGGSPLMTSAVATAEGLTVSGVVQASGARARIRGLLKIDTLAFDPRDLELTAGSVSWDGSTLKAPMARIRLLPAHKVGAEILALFLERPVWARGNVDLAAKSADVAFDASLAPEILEPISAKTGVELRHFADLSAPLSAVGRVRFSPGWKFEDVTARLDTGPFVAYHVAFEEARGNVYFDGSRLKVSDAYGLHGDDYVLGSYEQDFRTQDFRYLLTGRLRPLNISAWFAGDWWDNIFGTFAFPKQPPDANIDVSGRYSKVRHFSVYGYATVPGPIVKGVPFDTLRTIIYVNEFAADGLEIAVTQGTGSAEGSFKLSTEPAQGTWTGLDIDATSAIDPVPLGKLLPAEGAAAIAAFSFNRAPAATIHGHFNGPAAAEPQHKQLHTVVRSDTPLHIHGVPFDRATFTVDLNDDAIDVSNVDAGFAGGTVDASAHVTGEGAGRRLSFKASLSGASLGLAAEAAAGYVVSAKAGASTAMNTFAKDKSGVRLDLNVSGEGQLGDLASFEGDGNFQIQGSKLGELSLLGGLSKALKFTELRFTQARATFKIKDAALDFPDLSVLGANSQIRAKGTYSIDHRTLDFSANIYPFMEGKAPLQLFNAISAPISALLRVRLSGSIDKPSWRLAYSPLNLLRVEDAKAGAPDKAGAPPLMDTSTP
jgi:hypothetical protein